MRLLFDLDGTLTNPLVGFARSVQHAMTALGRVAPPEEELGRFIGPLLHDSFRILLGSHDEELVLEAVRLYRERYGTVGLFENEVYSGIADSLQKLSQEGHRLSVATSKPTVFAKQILDHFELSEFFCSVDGSELNGVRGDKTSLLAHVIERDGLIPSEVVMIGDTKFDMIGSVNNGVRGVGVLWGFGSQEELLEAGASECLGSPSELTSLRF
ncbi:MAG: HAD hydrolase-like protein [Roseibacillus sp.]